jgi:hypothetical protein
MLSQHRKKLAEASRHYSPLMALITPSYGSEGAFVCFGDERRPESEASVQEPCALG